VTRPTQAQDYLRVDAGRAGSPLHAETRAPPKARNSRVASRVPDYFLTFNPLTHSPTESGEDAG